MTAAERMDKALAAGARSMIGRPLSEQLAALVESGLRALAAEQDHAHPATVDPELHAPVLRAYVIWQVDVDDLTAMLMLAEDGDVEDDDARQTLAADLRTLLARIPGATP
jgi:hypothetical protein